MSDNFWSRRRAAVQAETQAEAQAADDAVQARELTALEERPDDEILAELNLPNPDMLKSGDDFTAFMAKAVPERIRRRALRTLWASNPVLANVDHLVEYGEDYTDSATVVENLQTAYQVGKGMLKHVEEMARQAAEADQPVAEDEDDLEEPIVLAEAEVSDAVDGPAYCVPEPEEELEATPMPRRMKFRIEEPA